jgi:hypothetical protein
MLQSGLSLIYNLLTCHCISLTQQYVAAHPGDACSWVGKVILCHLQEGATAVKLVANDLAARKV